jgi:hypothetical protein
MFENCVTTFNIFKDFKKFLDKNLEILLRTLRQTCPYTLKQKNYNLFQFFLITL